MAISDFNDWIGDFGRPGFIWYAKRLAANDTLATHAHQAGPYVPKGLLFKVFPTLNHPEARNPDLQFDLIIDSHSDRRSVRAVWYNNALFGGTRDEGRLTRFGGASSALLDPESTGALAIFAFDLNATLEDRKCHVWVCGEPGIEADLFEERFGPIEPKQHLIWVPGETAPQLNLYSDSKITSGGCQLTPAEIPPAWLDTLPTGEEIIGLALKKHTVNGAGPDIRMLGRRKCEFEIFLSVEEAFYLPRIKVGFASVQNFVDLAQSVLQSRKSRSGNSLELHAREIMREEGLRQDIEFSHRPLIKEAKRPDFLFPSQAAYDDPDFPDSRLRMLACKTTCKDRWRQALNEANRIKTKHILTLQEGVSEGQFQEMTDAKVKLVVPERLHRSYPGSVRPHLITLESFIGDIRLLGTSA